MPLSNSTRSDPSRQSNTISARAALTAASAPRVRVTFPGGSPSPSTCATPAPAAAQLRHTSRNQRRPPGGPARATFSSRSRGRPAQTQALGWAELPRELLEKVGRAVPAGDRLWFWLVCRSWAAAGAEIAQAAGVHLKQGKVTRTRGADAAASVARAEMVRRVLEGRALNDFERGICNYAAGGGCLSVLKWAQAQGCPSDVKTCAEAAGCGHLAVLQWARPQGCPWDKTAYS